MRYCCWALSRVDPGGILALAMFLPPGFDKPSAVEAADLVLQAYKQFDSFKNNQQWTVAGNYQTLGLLEARPEELSLGREPFGFVVRNLASGNVFVTFRGTESIFDWLADFTIPQVAHPWGAVEKGFDFIYQQCTGSVKAAVTRAPGSPVFATGHSLGAALAALAAADLVIAGIAAQLYNFASPRTGDPAFAAKFNQLVPTRWRIANTEDLVTTLPLATPNLGVAPGMKGSAVRLILARLDQLEYEHVGDAVPFTVQHGSITANHDMQMYRATVNAA
jgi:triacylglycerol lipase